MLRSNFLFLLMIAQFALWSQGEVVKYQFSDNYETDETYQKISALHLESIKDVNRLRDSIIYTNAIPEQDKLFALQLVNMLFESPEEVIRIKNQNGALFPWFQIRPKEEIETLVSNYSTYHYASDLIKATYNDLKSNSLYSYINKKPDNLDAIIDFVGLNKVDRRKTVYLRNVFSTIGVDKCFRNKDISFSCFNFQDFNRIVWSQQFYAHKKMTKRNNSYSAYKLGSLDDNHTAYFDYILEVQTIGSLYYYEREIAMLNDGGKFYIQIDYKTKEEYKTQVDYFKNRIHQNPDQYSSTMIKPHFTRESLMSFLENHGLRLEKEEKDGDVYKYVFVKSDREKN